MTLKNQVLKKRAEFAKELSLHPETVTRWAEQEMHGLKLVKLGKLVFIDVTDFNTEGAKDEASK